jgi:hypothetical protein
MPDAPRRVVVDTGPLIALFDAGDEHVATVDRDFAIYRYKGRGKFI